MTANVFTWHSSTDTSVCSSARDNVCTLSTGRKSNFFAVNERGFQGGILQRDFLGNFSICKTINSFWWSIILPCPCQLSIIYLVSFFQKLKRLRISLISNISLVSKCLTMALLKICSVQSTAIVSRVLKVFHPPFLPRNSNPFLPRYSLTLIEPF